MKNLIISLILLIFIFSLTGCADVGTKTSMSKHPDAEEILGLDENADIFQWDGLIYETNIDWVNELKLTKNEQLGEITESFSNSDAKNFKNGMANKLPVGTKIYSAKESEGILIVEHNNEEKYYLALVEG
ncbi:hypothetical protein [Bacillus rubiinfantis]|uniref:hypothetical protein n=1 Tax=Bacillus rubiinfantis TaxID=1499680 RepID=UPI0005A8B81B|nr:hypothetical protein [Bacillus rubiinfantis]